MHCNCYVMQFYRYSYLHSLTAESSEVRLCFMSDHLRAGRLELIHEIADLVDRNMLWSEIARLGMTREFIERRGDFFGRIVLELDYIEKKFQTPSLTLKGSEPSSHCFPVKKKARTSHFRALHKRNTVFAIRLDLEFPVSVNTLFSFFPVVTPSL